MAASTTGEDFGAEPETVRRRGGYGSLGVALGTLVAVWGAVLASFPLKDNSFLTHLATGRIILDTGSVPTSDPYTFTVPGVDWTVQSWLASVLYAAAERIGGDAGLRLLVLAVFLVASALLWRLSRDAESIVVRILLVTAALVVASDTWSERPYMIGVIGLSIVWLALEGSVRPWLLVPLMWVWANTHGSFPFAIALVLSVLVGSALDQRSRREPGARGNYDLTIELSALKFMVIGTALAVVGPLGTRVLTFPIKSLTQSEVLADIVEWKAPAFTSLSQRVFLLLVLCGIASLTRIGRWRHALPTIGFMALALLAQRNIVMALVVMIPIIAAAAPSVGTLTARDRPPTGPVLTTVALALLAAIVVTSLSGSVTDLEPYPERAVAWVAAADPDRSAGNLATPDFVGNLYEALDGPIGTVFVDDRADMYPPDFFADSRALARGERTWSRALDEHRSSCSSGLGPANSLHSLLWTSDGGWSSQTSTRSLLAAGDQAAIDSTADLWSGGSVDRTSDAVELLGRLATKEEDRREAHDGYQCRQECIFDKAGASALVRRSESVLYPLCDRGEDVAHASSLLRSGAC